MHIDRRKFVGDLSPLAMHKLAKELIDDWKTVAYEFSDLFSFNDINVRGNNRSLTHSEYLLERLKESSISLIKIYKVFYNLKLESSCSILESEMPKDEIEKIHQQFSKIQQQQQQPQVPTSSNKPGNFLTNTAGTSRSLSAQNTSLSHQQPSITSNSITHSMLGTVSTPLSSSHLNEKSLLPDIRMDNRHVDTTTTLKSLPTTGYILQQSLQPSFTTPNELLVNGFNNLSLQQPMQPHQQQFKYPPQSQFPYDFQSQAPFIPPQAPPYQYNLNDMLVYSQQQFMQQQLLFQQQQQKFVDACEIVMPMLANEDIVNELNSIGKFSIVKASKRKLSFLKFSFDNFNDYLKELKMIKCKHANLLIPEFLFKNPAINEVSLLYPYNDSKVTLTLHEFITSGKKFNLITNILIAKDIACGLSFLHSKSNHKLPLFYGNANCESILVEIENENEAHAKLTDFKNTLTIEGVTDENKLLLDEYEYGLILISIIASRIVSRKECDELHVAENREPSDKEKRLFRFNVKSKYLPDTPKIPDKDILSQLFMYFWAFTSTNFNRKVDLEKAIAYMEESYVKLKQVLKQESEQEQQHQHIQRSGIWPS